jgi:hypothetical protein
VLSITMSVGDPLDLIIILSVTVLLQGPGAVRFDVR